jgi:hypothetical protein
MQRGDELRVTEGASEGIGLPTGRFPLRGSIDRSVESATLEAAVAAMSQALCQHGFRESPQLVTAFFTVVRILWVRKR